MSFDLQRGVPARYRNSAFAQSGNPFLEAMPDTLGQAAFYEAIKSLPQKPVSAADESAATRRMQLVNIQSIFYPMGYMYAIYTMLHQAILTTYSTKSVRDEIIRINELRKAGQTGVTLTAYATQPDSGSILGVPGIGKTSTVRRCLGLIPQLITHTEYHSQPFYAQQVTHLIVECPSDCSVKTLAYNIAAAVDRAIGSEYLGRMLRIKSLSVSAAATQVKIICINCHIGVIVIDEIQNAVTTAERNRQVKPLIKFLVELTNDTSTSVYFVGTPIAEDLFVSQDHLKRRSRGLRLLPLKPNRAYRDFLGTLWEYQYTARETPLTEGIANRLYDYSAGIPAYLVKLFQEAQSQAIMTGKERIDAEMVKLAADRLALHVPKVFSGGCHISDFEAYVTEGDYAAVQEMQDSEDKQIVETPRLYAVQRGRKKAQRENTDLIEMFKKSKSADDMAQRIEALGLREVSV